MIDKVLARRVINRIQKSMLTAQYGDSAEARERALLKASSLIDLLYDVLHLETLEINTINILKEG